MPKLSLPKCEAAVLKLTIIGDAEDISDATKVGLAISADYTEVLLPDEISPEKVLILCEALKDNKELIETLAYVDGSWEQYDPDVHKAPQPKGPEPKGPEPKKMSAGDKFPIGSKTEIKKIPKS